MVHFTISPSHALLTMDPFSFSVISHLHFQLFSVSPQPPSSPLRSLLGVAPSSHFSLVQIGSSPSRSYQQCSRVFQLGNKTGSSAQA